MPRSAAPRSRSDRATTTSDARLVLYATVRATVLYTTVRATVLYATVRTTVLYTTVRAIVLYAAVREDREHRRAVAASQTLRAQARWARGSACLAPPSSPSALARSMSR